MFALGAKTSAPRVRQEEYEPTVPRTRSSKDEPPGDVRELM